MPPSIRSAGFVVHFDPGTIPSIRERFYPAFQAHLVLTLGDVVESILQDAGASLVPLAADHIPYDNVMGGLDTTRMREGLTYALLEAVTDGVFYEMKASDVYYWKFIEFGHFVATANGPRWWEGYHFFEKAIKRHTAAIMVAARLAWHRAAAEQSVTSFFRGGGISQSVLASLTARGAIGG